MRLRDEYQDEEHEEDKEKGKHHRRFATSKRRKMRYTDEF